MKGIIAVLVVLMALGVASQQDTGGCSSDSSSGGAMTETELWVAAYSVVSKWFEIFNQINDLGPGPAGLDLDKYIDGLYGAQLHDMLTSDFRFMFTDVNGYL